MSQRKPSQARATPITVPAEGGDSMRLLPCILLLTTANTCSEFHADRNDVSCITCLEEPALIVPRRSGSKRSSTCTTRGRRPVASAPCSASWPLQQGLMRCPSEWSSGSVEHHGHGNGMHWHDVGLLRQSVLPSRRHIMSQLLPQRYDQHESRMLLTCRWRLSLRTVSSSITTVEQQMLPIPSLTYSDTD